MTISMAAAVASTLEPETAGLNAIIITDAASTAKKPALIVQCEVRLRVALIVFKPHQVEHYARTNAQASAFNRPNAGPFEDSFAHSRQRLNLAA